MKRETFLKSFGLTALAFVMPIGINDKTFFINIKAYDQQSIIFTVEQK